MPAELHNIEDLQIIQVLQMELIRIRSVARRLGNYDPADSLDEILSVAVDTGELLAVEHDRMKRELSYKQSEVDALKEEKYAKTDPTPAPGWPFGNAGAILGSRSQW